MKSFIATLFTVAKDCKQSKYSLAIDFVNKKYIYTIIYYEVIKKKSIYVLYICIKYIYTDREWAPWSI